MADAKAALMLRVYEDYATTALVDDLTGRWVNLRWSSALHGGFRELHATIPMPLEEAWGWLRREGAVGQHYRHVELTDRIGTVWEGRIVDIGLRADNGVVAIDVAALGYWSSMRDQFYDAGDPGNTDWTVGSHNTGKIIREMVTNECPDINGTADIELTPEDITIDLTARAYPQDIIVGKLAPLAGTGTAVYHFSVWEERKPKWTSRSLSSIHWLVNLRDIERLNINQAGSQLRNYVLPVVGTAEGTSTVNTESTASYPRREAMLALESGVPTTAANNARDAMLQERRFPVQSESFTIKGNVISTRTGNLSQSLGMASEERSKWWVRAGDVIRIRDLVPYSQATGTLDNLRTFYILEASYDAARDSLDVQPDRPGNVLGAILARLGTVEKRA